MDFLTLKGLAKPDLPRDPSDCPACPTGTSCFVDFKKRGSYECHRVCDNTEDCESDEVCACSTTLRVAVSISRGFPCLKNPAARKKEFADLAKSVAEGCKKDSGSEWCRRGKSMHALEVQRQLRTKR